jgi:hypothetical protein
MYPGFVCVHFWHDCPVLSDMTARCLVNPSPAVEVGDSRLYGGVHFNTSNVDGLIVGRVVGNQPCCVGCWQCASVSLRVCARCTLVQF